MQSTACAVTMVRDDLFFLRIWLDYYGGILGPENWVTGTGLNASVRLLSNHSRGAEELLAIAPYFDKLAVFGKDVIQI